MRAYVAKIEPSEIKDWVRNYDKKTKKYACMKSGGGTNPQFFVQMLCKDVSTSSNSNVYKLQVCSNSDDWVPTCNEFFRGLKPDNLFKNAESRKKLEECSQAMTRFNSWIEAVVERKNGWYFVKDTKLTIV